MAAIGEHDGGRAVPRLHHGGVVLVKGLAAQVHAGVVFPRFGDHHHHRLRQRVAGHGQEFEHVVKGGGVGLAGEADRVELLQIVAQHGGRHHALARLHPVVVALDGVDFAVVRDVAVRMRQRPLGEGVGGKTLMHQPQRRDATRVLQVVEIGAHLIGQQQALVNHGAAAHAHHVILFAVGELQALDVAAAGLADHVQLALQRVLHDHIAVAANEHLANDRFLGPHRGRHRHLAVHRHIAPAQQHLPLSRHRALHLLLAGQARRVFFGQKQHTHAVLAQRRQGHTTRGELLAVQRIWQLNQQTRAVTHQLVGTHRASVVQVLQNFQRLRHDGVALLPLDVRHKTHTASVVLMGRVVQTVLLEMLLLGCRGHGASFKVGDGEKLPAAKHSAAQQNRQAN